MNVDPKDLKIEAFKSPTGMINRIDTGIRITHIPTGIVITCHEERSQLMNRLRAVEELVSRLAE
jgi:protein subunit release factor A